MNAFRWLFGDRSLVAKWLGYYRPDAPVQVPSTPAPPVPAPNPPAPPPAPAYPPRPTAFNHGRLPPFDPSDHGGLVHTSLPPEQIIPKGPNKLWWRGDFGGITTKLTPPFVPGANTTPANMWMSFFLHKYSRYWQDVYLTEYCERGYTHILLAFDGSISIAAYVDLCTYVKKRYGLYIVNWGGCPQIPNSNWAGWTAQGIVKLYDALASADAIDLCVLGEELNRWNKPGADGLDDIIHHACDYWNPKHVPLYLHFTANYPSWQGSGTPIDWWRMWRGRLQGLCWQGDQNDSAGLMGARMWDSRKYLAAAGGTDLHLVAFELMASNQLFGKCDELHGNLRGWEMICCPIVPGSGAAPVMGFNNGARYPNGDPI